MEIDFLQWQSSVVRDQGLFWNGRGCSLNQYQRNGCGWSDWAGRHLSLSLPNIIQSQHSHPPDMQDSFTYMPRFPWRTLWAFGFWGQFGKPSLANVKRLSTRASFPDIQGYKVYLTEQNSLVEENAVDTGFRWGLCGEIQGAFLLRPRGIPWRNVRYGISSIPSHLKLMQDDFLCCYP